MLFSELLCFQSFQWKLQVPSFSRLSLYSVKGLACATQNPTKRSPRQRQKLVLCSVHQITQLHIIKSPLAVREIMLVFSKENCSVSDCRVVRNLKQLLDHNQSIMAHSTSTWPAGKQEKQSRYPALLRGACQQPVPSRKWTLNTNKHPIFISYTKG